MNTNLIPRTRSTDPVKILRVVAKAILEEPLRYDQNLWLMKTSNYPSIFDPKFGGSRQAPSCGTIACVAGWTCTVTRSTESNHVAKDAPDILGLTIEEADELFHERALDKYCPSDFSYPTGSLAYAKLGVRHITEFVKKKWGVELGVPYD